jgi:ParB-like chromosome segregation protein Spo0J
LDEIGSVVREVLPLIEKMMLPSEAECPTPVPAPPQASPKLVPLRWVIRRHELKALAEDIRRNGLRNPPEVLPKNRAGYPPDTLVAGHMRAKALLLNGETEVEVIVKYDLADADEATIEKCFLEDNLNRRHMDMLSKARVALRRFEIEKKRPRGGLRPFEEREARDRVGKATRTGGRNLSRYFRVLKTPPEVQNAFRAGKLALVVAEKVAERSATPWPGSSRASGAACTTSTAASTRSGPRW